MDYFLAQGIFKHSFSVYCAWYSEETQHDYRLKPLAWKTVITNGAACLSFNKCVPMCMNNSFMPMMRPCAKRLSHYDFIIAK